MHHQQLRQHIFLITMHLLHWLNQQGIMLLLVSLLVCNIIIREKTTTQNSNETMTVGKFVTLRGRKSVTLSKNTTLLSYLQGMYIFLNKKQETINQQQRSI